MVAGPLKLAEEIITRAVSVMSEKSSNSAVMIESMSLHAALDVTIEEKVRVVSSVTRGQTRLNEGSLAQAVFAKLF